MYACCAAVCLDDGLPLLTSPTSTSKLFRQLVRPLLRRDRPVEPIYSRGSGTGLVKNKFYD